jgi:hypothetical protein
MDTAADLGLRADLMNLDETTSPHPSAGKRSRSKRNRSKPAG